VRALSLSLAHVQNLNGLRMEEVKDHYQKVLEKTGIALDGRQLLAWIKSRKLGGIKNSEVYSFLRREAGSFAKPVGSVKTYQTVSPLRHGVYFIDYGEFHKSWSGSNGGATGFLVAVENVTCRLFVLPTRGKDTKQWLQSIERFVELTRQVTVIYSDRDSVATSSSFRTDLFRRFGIRWHFLRSRHKSFLAERYIGYVKTKLSRALERASERKGSPVKRWVDYVEPLLDIYNSQKVGNTSYRRKAVSRENFNDFLKQLFGGDRNYDLRFNSYSVGEFQHHPDWNRRIFKYSLGDRVRVHRRADWSDPENRLGFAKASTRGSYGKKTYPVVGRQLRSDKTYTKFVPVYSLGETPPGAGFTFYESDLTLAAAAAAAEQKQQQ